MQKLREVIDIMNPKGVIIHPSPYSVKQTIDRLEAFLQQHGATIYARIDQQAELQKAGQSIAPLEFIMFGNPKAGGPIMIENPVSALDLPLKVIAWEDDQKNVYVAYNDGIYIEDRYSLLHNANSPLNLDSLVSMALKP
jgi:uncharacterized protein (DUF302 family)